MFQITTMFIELSSFSSSIIMQFTHITRGNCSNNFFLLGQKLPQCFPKKITVVFISVISSSVYVLPCYLHISYQGYVFQPPFPPLINVTLVFIPKLSDLQFIYHHGTYTQGVYFSTIFALRKKCYRGAYSYITMLFSHKLSRARS